MANQYKTPYLDYYGKHDIAPVSQDITNLDKHFERRNALYRHCGLPSALIEGRSVLEVGPGTGHNALFTNALKPNRYLLVDGNPKSVQETNRLLKSYFNDLSNCEIIQSNFDDFRTDEQFDVVLCEGTIPLQIDPMGFLSKLSKFVKPSGLLLITCADHVSLLAESLRRIAARLMMGDPIHDDEKLNRLRPFIERSLRNLTGMSRPVDDWIHDNILQPIIGRILSIEDAVKCLEDEFDAYAVSPHFATDWRWYKDIYGTQQRYNRLVIDSYRNNIHNLLDYRYVFDRVEPETIEALERLSRSVFEIAVRMQDDRIDNGVVSELKDRLHGLSGLTQKFSQNTDESIQEFIKAVDHFLDKQLFPSVLPKFEPWFGRGQQYLSFVRKERLALRAMRPGHWVPDALETMEAMSCL